MSSTLDAEHGVIELRRRFPIFQMFTRAEVRLFGAERSNASPQQHPLAGTPIFKTGTGRSEQRRREKLALSLGFAGGEKVDEDTRRFERASRRAWPADQDYLLELLRPLRNDRRIV
jgi:hypothetical protein